MADMEDFVLARKQRSDAAYGVKEREAIHKYKVTYRAATTPAERDLIFRRDVCVTLWNYWSSQKMNPPRSGDKFRFEIKKLAQWIHNNWRPKVHRSKDGYTMRKIRDLEVIADMYADKMTAVYKDLLGVEEIRTIHTQAIFKNRTAAAKIVKEALSVTERRELETEIRRRQREGVPAHTQLRNAKRGGAQKIKTAAGIWRKEMDMTTLVFFAYKREDDKICVGFNADFDQKGRNNIQKFSTAYSEKVLAMQRNIIEYMKKIETPQLEIAADGDDNAAEMPEELNKTDEGFPLLPANLQNANKAELDRIAGAFIAAHYALAGGCGQVPWTALSTQTKVFVKTVYMPRHFILKKPKDIKTNKLRQLLMHIYNREEAKGPHDSFRFQKVIKRRGRVPSEATYFGERGEDLDDDGSLSPPRQILPRVAPEPNTTNVVHAAQLHTLMPLQQSRGITPGNMPLPPDSRSQEWDLPEDLLNGAGAFTDQGNSNLQPFGEDLQWERAGISSLGFDVPFENSAHQDLSTPSYPFGLGGEDHLIQDPGPIDIHSHENSSDSSRQLRFSGT